jgi:putative Holliday junction resolvase
MSENAMRVLVFDFGLKRIGVAVGQTLTGTAQPLEPIKANDGVPGWPELERLVNEWQPDAFLVGLPLNMDGSVSDMSLRAKKFGNRLHGRLHKPIHFFDERLSSFEAKGLVMSQGGDRDFGRNSVDGIAAALIFESWVATRH